MSGPNFSATQLKSFADRLDLLDEELKTINADKAEVFKELVSAGFDKKPLKIARAKRKAMSDDPVTAQSDDAMAELYFEAISGQGATQGRSGVSSVAANDGLAVSLAHAHEAA